MHSEIVIKRDGRNSMSRLRRTLIALIGAAVIGGACGSDAADGGEATTATTASTTAVPNTTIPNTTTSNGTTSETTTSETTTSLTPTTSSTSTSVPAPVEINSVLVAGDSLARGLYPPLEAALEGPDREVDWEWVIGVVWPDIAPTWERIFTVDQPDLLFVQLGTWENYLLREDTIIDTSDPAWKETYRRDFVDPWVKMAETSGSRVVWVAMPKSSEPGRSDQHLELDAIWRSAIEESAATHSAIGVDAPITWQDSAGVLTGLDGEFQAVDNSVEPPIRLFNIDGLHWCPGGAARMTEVLLGHLAEDLVISARPGWQDLGWDMDLEAYPPGECPTPST